MKPKIQQRRAEILRRMGEIQEMERGKICEMRRASSSGEPRVYYNHQVWEGGRNRSRYVGTEEAEHLSRAIEGHEHFETLAREFVELTIASTREEKPLESKKTPGRNRACQKHGSRKLPLSHRP
jgi:hypothetical protein